MPNENLTTKLLEQQIAEVEKRLAENRALLKVEEENLKKLELEKNPSLNPADTVEKTESNAPVHPAFEKIDARLQTIETKFSGTLSAEQKKAFEQEKSSLLRRKEALAIALDPTKNDIEKIGLILENGIDKFAIGKTDFDTEISTYLFERARKNGKGIEPGKKIQIADGKGLETKGEIWLQIDRGGKNGIYLETTDDGAVVITIDHHEMGKEIKPTSAAEGVYSLLQKLGYDWNFNTSGPDGKNSATIDKNLLKKILVLTRKEDNLTYDYTLDELLTIYPASLPGIVHLINPREAVRLGALYPRSILGAFPKEAYDTQVLLKNGKKDTLGALIKKQRDNFDGTEKGFVALAVDLFESAEKKSQEKWEVETDKFGKTLLLVSAEFSIPSKIAYAKGYDTLVLLDEQKKSLAIFSKDKDLSLLYEEIKQTYPDAVFPRGKMILLRGAASVPDENTVAGMLGLKEKKSPTTEPTPIHTEFRAGDSIGAHGKTEQPFPTPRNTTFASEPPTIKEDPESLFGTNEVIQPKKEKPKLLSAEELRRMREERFGKPFDDTTKQ